MTKYTLNMKMHSLLKSPENPMLSPNCSAPPDSVKQQKLHNSSRGKKKSHSTEM